MTDHNRVILVLFVVSHMLLRCGVSNGGRPVRADLNMACHITYINLSEDRPTSYDRSQSCDLSVWYLLCLMCYCDVACQMRGGPLGPTSSWHATSHCYLLCLMCYSDVACQMEHILTGWPPLDILQIFVCIMLDDHRKVMFT